MARSAYHSGCNGVRQVHFWLPSCAACRSRNHHRGPSHWCGRGARSCANAASDRRRRRCPTRSSASSATDRPSSRTGRAGRCGRPPCSRGSWRAPARPRRHAADRTAAEHQQAAAGRRADASVAHHRADMGGVTLSKLRCDLGAQRVQFGLELIELGGSGGFWAWGGPQVDQTWGTGGSGALTEHNASN